MTSAVRREPLQVHASLPYQTFWLSAVEKMFQQAMDEQHVEKLAKEGQKVRNHGGFWEGESEGGV